MSPLYMYDAAYSPSLIQARQHGAIAMSHYMTRSYAGTSAQPSDTRALGMGAFHNWEGYADELKGASREKGRLVAHEALAALSKSAPRNGKTAIAYSVDTDLTDLSACDAAFQGINDVHKGTGVRVKTYCEGGLMIRLHRLGLVHGKQWLSMSEGFGKFHDALNAGVVAVVQMHDAKGNWIGTDIPGTDRNTIIDPYDLGAWWPSGSKYLNRTESEFTVDAAAKKEFDQTQKELGALRADVASLTKLTSRLLDLHRDEGYIRTEARMLLRRLHGVKYKHTRPWPPKKSSK